jgi:hypothetical protein
MNYLERIRTDPAGRHVPRCGGASGQFAANALQPPLEPRRAFQARLKPDASRLLLQQGVR